MFSGLEKRKLQRLEFPLEVTVNIVSVQEMPRDLPTLHLKSRNIAIGGLCLETKAIEVDGVNLLSGLPFARQNRLQMSMDLIPEEPPFKAIGEVLWYDISRDIPEFIYRLGVTFLEIKNDGKNQLTRFLKCHTTHG